jgi:hypothetical protein
MEAWPAHCLSRITNKIVAFNPGRRSYRMPNPKRYPPLAQLKLVAERLAAKVVPVTHVPGKPLARTDDQPLFVESVVELVLRLRERDRRATGTKPGGLLDEAAKAARRLDHAYTHMNQRDREWVEHIKQLDSHLWAHEIHDMQTTISHLSILFHFALGKTYPLPKRAWHGRLGMGGAKVRDQLLRELVFGLLRTAKETRGKFTFNVNSAGGTLADALDRLRPHLPNGLVPQPLHARTIQRLKNEFSRLSRSGF